MPEIIDPVFAKTSQSARFLLSENERFGLVFVKTGSTNSDTGERRKRNQRKCGACYKFFFKSVVGLAISDKKIFCGRRNRRNNW